MNKQKEGSRVGSRYLIIHETELLAAAAGVGISSVVFFGTGSITRCRQQGHDVRFDSHSVRH